jgi:hypothetical protein
MRQQEAVLIDFKEGIPAFFEKCVPQFEEMTTVNG